jgi:putative oxidoreductase
VPVLIGATWAHAGNGWLFTNKGGGWEYPLFLAFAAVAQALLGGGAFALTSDAARQSDASKRTLRGSYA